MTLALARQRDLTHARAAGWPLSRRLTLSLATLLVLLLSPRPKKWTLMTMFKLIVIRRLVAHTLVMVINGNVFKF